MHEISFRTGTESSRPEGGAETLSSWEMGPRMGHAGREMRQVLP